MGSFLCPLPRVTKRVPQEVPTATPTFADRSEVLCSMQTEADGRTSRTEPALFTLWDLGWAAGRTCAGRARCWLPAQRTEISAPERRGPTNLPVSDPELACRDDTRAVCVVGPRLRQFRPVPPRYPDVGRGEWYYIV